MKKIIFLVGLIIIALLSCKGKTERPLEIVEQATDAAKPSAIETTLPAPIVNDPPKIVSIKLTPSSPVKNGNIKAEVLVQDNDIVTFDYRWRKNGEALPETSDTLSSGFKRGDNISVTVTPFDGKQRGAPVTVFTYIFNAPPKIISTIKDSKFERGSFAYQVKATDSDGDTLTYSLKTAPAGITIDPSTGLIKWNVPPEFTGKTPITISVTDGHGGEAMQSITIDIQTKTRERLT